MYCNHKFTCCCCNNQKHPSKANCPTPVAELRRGGVAVPEHLLRVAPVFILRGVIWKMESGGLGEVVEGVSAGNRGGGVVEVPGVKTVLGEREEQQRSENGGCIRCPIAAPRGATKIGGASLASPSTTTRRDRRSDPRRRWPPPPRPPPETTTTTVSCHDGTGECGGRKGPRRSQRPALRSPRGKRPP